MTAEPVRLCSTPDAAFSAGWDDGADDRPLSQDEIDRLAALHAPYLRAHDDADSAA